MENLKLKPQDTAHIDVEEKTSEAVPLVVDLDGTLILGNLLLESVFALLKRSLHFVFFLPLWLCCGRAAFKAEIARQVDLDVSTVLFNRPFIEFLKKEKARGRRLFLATGSHETLARKVADTLGLFDGVLASNGIRNNTGHEKLALLRQHFRGAAFDYAGNATADFPIWKAARRATVVNASPRVARWAARNAAVEHVFPPRTPGLGTYLRALRVHQWLKNLLVFVPLIASLRFTELQALTNLGIAFLAFSLCASSVYVLNDIVDIHDDRRQPSKRNRPFAAGELSLSHGFILVPALLAAAVPLALYLPWEFGAVLVAYYATTVAYTFKLKQLEVMDVFVLAMLYTIRIVAGGAAAGIALSFWLLAFGVFIFLSLALIKRCAELVVLREHGGQNARGRGYRVADLPVLYSMGTGSGYVAVLILGLYLNSAQVEHVYSTPPILWILVPLLIYWVTQVWLKAYRGEVTEDPVVFAARDPSSLVIAAISAIVIWLAM